MLVIVDYGVGNLSSIQNMIKRGGNHSLITGNALSIASATKILLPGMGHFDNCMIKLKESGLLPVIEKRVLNEKVPLLGICVGLQMLMNSSEEGEEQGLGWIKGKTVKFDTDHMVTGKFKIPNMGWLDVQLEKPSNLFSGLEKSRFYFAHSYHVLVDNKSEILVKSEYGYNFTAGIESENILGVQFHPEKSHRFGMQLLKNFVERY